MEQLERQFLRSAPQDWRDSVGRPDRLVPAILALAASDFFGFPITTWLSGLLVFLLWIFPLSFAYAVVKHRVLEILSCCGEARATCWCSVAL